MPPNRFVQIIGGQNTLLFRSRQTAHILARQGLDRGAGHQTGQKKVDDDDQDQQEEIVGICFLFLYRRLPHSDYPTGVIAELGACYTVPEYRRQGIMSELIGTCLENVPQDCPQVGAIVADASNQVIRILMNKYGFEDAVEGERRLWKQP